MAMQAPSARAELPTSPCATSDVDNLSFTSRDPEGRIRWWDVTPPKTDYWHVHEMLGRAYAFEFIDLIQEKDKKLSKHTFGFIASEIVRQGRTMNDGLYFGFFCAISEYLIEGRVSR